MAKTWVLQTQTKGTGATMVPLESVLRKPGSEGVEDFVLPELRQPESEHDEARQPHVFKVIDVMTREVLAENADARSTVAVLEDVPSIVDVTVYVWDAKAERWRLLTFGETKALWEYRGRLQKQPEPVGSPSG
jgi:hypothetical protein